MKHIQKTISVKGKDGIEREGWIDIFLGEKFKTDPMSTIVVNVSYKEIWRKSFSNTEDNIEDNIKQSILVLKIALEETNGISKKRIKELMKKYKFI